VPAYAARSLTGDSIRLGGDGPPTVLNVWATWCTSCREEMALLDSVTARVTPRGARVVAVSVDESETERVRRYVESSGVRFIVAHDQAGEVERSFAVMGVPTTFVIDRTGRLVWSHTGNLGGARSALDSAVERALSR
jgi:thiol-disulfide isomerase/thioredoxin